MLPGGVSSGLFIGLPSLELRLQLGPERAVGPFFVPLPPIEEHPLPDLVGPPLTGGRQQNHNHPIQLLGEKTSVADADSLERKVSRADDAKTDRPTSGLSIAPWLKIIQCVRNYEPTTAAHHD